MSGGSPRVGSSHGKDGPNTDHGTVFPRYNGPRKTEVQYLFSYFTLKHGYLMDIYWNIMNWNIRGINSQERWDDIGNKIIESNCNIVCLQ